MKYKYITLQVMLGCLSTNAPKNDIHLKLEETIAERKQIMKQLKDFSQRARVVDMYLGSSKAA